MAHWSDVWNNTQVGFHTTVGAYAQLAARLPLVMVWYSFAGQWGDFLLTQLPNSVCFGEKNSCCKEFEMVSIYFSPRLLSYSSASIHDAQCNCITCPGDNLSSPCPLYFLLCCGLVWDFRICWKTVAMNKSDWLFSEEEVKHNSHCLIKQFLSLIATICKSMTFSFSCLLGTFLGCCQKAYRRFFGWMSF